MAAYVHYPCQLQSYGNQIFTAGAPGVDAPTEWFIPGLTYFPGSQGLTCKNQMFRQLWWHQS